MDAHNFYSLTRQGDTTILRLVGPILHDLTSDFRNHLLDCLQDNTVKNLVVNFEDVSTCSSNIIGALIMAKRRLESRGGQLTLCCLPASMLEKFKLLHLADKVFEIYDTEANALAAL